MGIGHAAPDFTLPSARSGKPRTLSSFRGKKILLSFHQGANCPCCQYAIEQLVGNHKKLAWACKLRVICVFQSTAETINKHILKWGADDNGESTFPFVVLTGVEEHAYDLYEVAVEGGTATRLPTDFLIDETGMIVDCFRGKTVADHMSVERIQHFLMTGENTMGIMVQLRTGAHAPGFTLCDVDGMPFSLSQYRGQKVMLSFYRYAGCPFSRYAIKKLKKFYKRLPLSGRERLNIVCIFQSPPESIKEYILKGRRTRDFPFIALSDPEEELYREYRIGADSSWHYGTSCAFLLPVACKLTFQGIVAGEQEGIKSRLPSDFFIDENGMIVDCFHAKSVQEHIPLKRAEQFVRRVAASIKKPGGDDTQMSVYDCIHR